MRYFKRQIELTGVKLKLGKYVSPNELVDFDTVILATGVLPRNIGLPIRPGTTKVNVVSYVDVLRHNVSVGERVAVIGAGGIGFDIADYITHAHQSSPPKAAVDPELVDEFLREWGIDKDIKGGGLKSKRDGDRKSVCRERV